MRVSPAGLRVADVARGAVMICLLGAGLALMIGLGGSLGWAYAILAGGALAAVLTAEAIGAVTLGASAGALGTLLAVLAYRAPGAIRALDGWHAGYSVGQVHKEFLAPLIRASAVNAEWGVAHVGLFLALTLGVAACAAGLHRVLRAAPVDARQRWRVLLATAAVGLVAAALVSGAWKSEFRTTSTRSLEAGSYQYDAAIYMNTYFNVLAGDPYYESIVKAAAGDKRLQRDRSVRNGKFYAWAYSAAFIRMPWTFQIWRTLAPTGGLWYVSLALSVLALFVVWWGMYPLLSVRAALIPPVLFPFLMACTAWMNMYFPDWWAALSILFSVMLQIRRRYLAAGVLAFLAGIFRDVALIWLVILLVHAIVAWWRTGAVWRTRSLVYAGLLAGFFVLYFAHLRAGAPFVAPEAHALDVAGRLRQSAAGGFAERFLAPARYMMVPYGALVGKWAAALALQIPGWWIVLRRDPHALWPVLGFSAFWLLFTLTVGATSSYWGPMYMLVALVGAAALVASACPAPQAE